GVTGVWRTQIHGAADLFHGHDPAAVGCAAGVPQVDVFGDIDGVVADLGNLEDGGVLVGPVGAAAAAAGLCPFGLLRVGHAILMADADAPLRDEAADVDLDEVSCDIIGGER